MHKLSVIEMHRISIDEFHEAEKLPLVVVLDNVRSAYNVGSVLRTADAFRIAGVILCGITPTPDRDPAGVHKTALGAEDSVDWQYCAEAADAVRKLQSQGCYVWSVEQVEGSLKLDHLDTELPPQAAQAPVQAIVLGNEVKGVSQEVVDQSDGCIEIPQFGTKHSLNVSTTAGIVMWKFMEMKLKK